MHRHWDPADASKPSIALEKDEATKRKREPGPDNAVKVASTVPTETSMQFHSMTVPRSYAQSSLENASKTRMRYAEVKVLLHMVSRCGNVPCLCEEASHRKPKPNCKARAILPLMPICKPQR